VSKRKSSVEPPSQDPAELSDETADIAAEETPADVELPTESQRELLASVDPEDSRGEDAYSEPEPEIESTEERQHLRGAIEALVFASDAPIRPKELAKLTQASATDVASVLLELRREYAPRGINLAEIAGGWLFRTNGRYAPFVRDLTKQKPVKLSRAQVETLAIIAYRQPVTRPEIDDVRGVDSGPVLKVLLERDLVRILGKRDEPGRPLIYGTTNVFLEFFGLKSLKDLPTLREFTELTEESRDAYEDELGEAFTEPSTDDEVSEPIVDEDVPAALDRELRDAAEDDALGLEALADDDNDDDNDDNDDDNDDDDDDDSDEADDDE
jgi:segregation and condensation protein B